MAVCTVRLNTWLFATATASLAVLTLCYGNAAIVGQSLPPGLISGEGWVYASALLLLASIGMCFPRSALSSLFGVGAWLTAWALVCLLPVFASPLNVVAWYGFCEALSTVAGAWILSVMLRCVPGPSVSAAPTIRVAQILFGLTCIYYGVSHLLYPDYTASMVPRWLPDPLTVAYATGVAHLAAGVAIGVGVLARPAAVLEALMMTLFGLLVWAPSFFMQPRPTWATPPAGQWSELVVNLLLAASAWIVAASWPRRETGPR